jgi:hypothetical protein
VIDMHAEGTGAVAALLEQVASRALNPEPAFDAITDRLIESEKRLFSSARVKPDKPATVKRKARSKDPRVRANAHNTLVATGALEKFLTTKAPGAQPIRLTKDELVFGVPGGRHDFHYARYQVKHGRNPLVSASTVRRYASSELGSFITRAAP